MRLPADSLKEVAVSCIRMLALNRAGRVVAGDAGAVKELLSVLQSSPSTSLRVTSLHALDSLCHFNTVNIDAFLGSDGEAVITALMKEGESSVQTQAGWVASNLISSSPAAAKRFVNVDAISAFGSALGSSNETLVIQSAMCLHSLAHDDVARGLMLENGYRSLSEPCLNHR